MKCNVGGKDRRVRYFLGGAGILFALIAPVAPRWKILSGLVGAIGFTTAATQYCPANALLHVDTCLPPEFEQEREYQLTMNYR